MYLFLLFAQDFTPQVLDYLDAKYHCDLNRAEGCYNQGVYHYELRQFGLARDYFSRACHLQMQSACNQTAYILRLLSQSAAVQSYYLKKNSLQ